MCMIAKLPFPKPECRYSWEHGHPPIFKIVNFIRQNVIYTKHSDCMKKNAFYIVVGCIALALLAIFWYSVELHIRFLAEAAFVLAIAIIYVIRTKVTDFIEDERTARITEQASLRTFQVFWVVFCALSIGAVMQILYVPTFPRDVVRNLTTTRPPEILGPRMMGYFQLGLLCLMIFLYVGFRIYYARKYGEWDTDEE